MTGPSTHRGTHLRHRAALAAAAGAGYVGATAWFSAPPRRGELAAFRASNAGGEYAALRLPQQLGTPWALLGAAALQLALGRPRKALVVGALLPVEKAVEVATKHLTDRRRPLFVTPTELRDDAPVDGPSYPSGHAAIAAAVAVVCLPELPRSAGAGLAATAVLGSWVRIHQGAHHPGDVVGGLLLGTCLGVGADALADLLRRRP